jgi:hypothetical protein
MTKCRVLCLKSLLSFLIMINLVFYLMLYFVMFNDIMLHHFLLFYNMLFYVMSYEFSLCYVVLSSHFDHILNANIPLHIPSNILQSNNITLSHIHFLRHRKNCHGPKSLKFSSTVTVRRRYGYGTGIHEFFRSNSL